MGRLVFALCVLVPVLALAQDDALPLPSPPPPPPQVEPIPTDIPPPPDVPPPEPQPVAPPQPPQRSRAHAREYGREPVEPPEVNWRALRKGFHWSLGLGAMVYPSGGGSGVPVEVVGYVAAVPSVSWSWGWVEAHVGVQALGYLSQTSKALFLALDPQLRINFARWYSLGFGPYLGVSVSPRVDFALGASLSPAIIKLGDRGQHEIAFWTASPFVFSRNQSSVTLFLLSYSYVF